MEQPAQPPRYRRVLLKLSGEALMGERGLSVDPDILLALTQEIAEVRALGVEIALVVGGGNFFRGAAATARGWTASPPTTWGCLRR